jgi:nicotinate-nucleotide pyrophosphorylase (carboxylating)
MPNATYQPVQWDDQLEDDARQLVRLAIREDLSRWHDWTTITLVPPNAQGAAEIIAREPGVVCGLKMVALVISETGAEIELTTEMADGDLIAQRDRVATISGSARDLLTCERTILNFLGRLSGVASLTKQYVELTAGTLAKIYDTRKTTPGWRRLEKYAVRCGGGCNHRSGVFDGLLIKDNHLAFAAELGQSPAAAVVQARQRIAELASEGAGELPIEVEVDSLEQLRNVLGAAPDIVLLDNLPPALLRQAVVIRNDLALEVVLEASGGINLSTVASVAATGVDRISVGALTHSARVLDFGLDWRR